MYSRQFLECQGALGMGSGAIADEQISSSSQLDVYHAASNGRLHFQATSNVGGSWSAQTNDVNQWLQIDLGNLQTTVTRVATQGNGANSQWVKRYKLQYSYEGFNFQYYSEQGENQSKVSYAVSI